MTSAKVFTAALAAALLLTTMASLVMVTQNSQLSSENSANATRLRMNTILESGQNAVEKELAQVRNLTFNLALSLRDTGLNGTAARAELNASLAASPYAIDIATFDTRGIIQAVEPEQYRYLEGVDLSGGNKTKELLLYKVPTLSNTFASRDIARGSGYACPVFNQSGVFIGAVSTLFNVSTLMKAVLPQLTYGTGFTWWAMQLDGTEIFDTDVTRIGHNLLYGPDYVNFPQVQALGWRMVNETSGHGSYSYLFSPAQLHVVNKECYWGTVGA
ncbi:MAG: hypothetical protein WCK39_11795, partial [Methanomassiliicoccales archaeon]